MKNQSPNLSKEVRSLRERIENQSCHIAVLERQLRTVLSAAGIGPVTVEAHLAETKVRRWSDAPAPRAPAADSAYWPTPQSGGKFLRPAPGHRAYAIKGTPFKVIGISVCGFSRREIEHIVGLVEQHQDEVRNFVPVFLTDSTEAMIFRSRGFIFEYLPPVDRVKLVGSKPWAEYAAERRRLLARKWGMVDIITFGVLEFGRPKPVPVADAAPVAVQKTGKSGLPKVKVAAGATRRRGAAISRTRGERHAYCGQAA